MKNARKIITVGVIALFLGLATTPMVSALNKEKSGQQEDVVPVELSYYQADGKVVIITQKLTAEDMKILEEFYAQLQDGRNSGLVWRIIEWLLSRLDMFDKFGGSNWLDQLPGYPIVSFGTQRQLIPKYIPSINLRKFFNFWRYSTMLGATVIWGNGLQSPPTKFLLGKQIGFMIMFVGLHIQIPQLISGTGSLNFFLGSATFSWGTAL
jgi:hypothetical protein